MSSTVERDVNAPGRDPEDRPETLSDPSSPIATLTPVLGAGWELELRHLLLVLGFCLFFMYHGYIPLFHSDVWGHVAYGNWILDHKQLPTEEPFVANAEGVPIVDTAWLGQVVLAAAGRMGDAEWYSYVFAMTAILTTLVLARTFYLQARNSGVAVLSALLTFIFCSSRHAIIRPEIFGSLCFAVLIWIVVKADEQRSRRTDESAEPATTTRLAWQYWAGLPLLFALWANLHGSFVVGLAVLGSYAAGRAIEVLWSTWSFNALLGDRLFRRWLVLTELGVAGTLINPYGADLLVHTLMFGSNPNLKDVLEWFPLNMVSLEAIPMAISWVLLVVLLRHSRARMTASDVMLLCVFTLAVCLRVRMISWYAPVLMLVLTPHLGDIVRQLSLADITQPLKEVCKPLYEKSFRYTMFTGLIVWMAFAFSPMSRPVLGGKPRAANQVYSLDTPLDLTDYLRKHPPEGMVAAPQWWGDWLVWAGPKSLQVLMTTNSVHVVPPKVWEDYLAIARAAPGLERRLDRYRINTIVVGKVLQPQLQKVVEGMNGWEVVYEDKISLMAVRKKSAPKTATPPEHKKDVEVTQTESAP